VNDRLRKKLQEALNGLSAAKTIVDECATEEADSFDKLPNSMREGDKGDKFQAATDALEEASNEIDNAVSNIETAME
jgi:division protein CdvB (Snf7/Vps24/ESCRT-III family)